VCPGLHTLPGDCAIVWWDPTVLKLGAEPSLGIRKPELIGKDVASAVVESGLKTYNTWRKHRDDTDAEGGVASINLTTAGQYASAEAAPNAMPEVEIIELPRTGERPSGRRFGSLVHAVLATVPLDAGADVIERLTSTHARILGCPTEERAAAADLVGRVLDHEVIRRAAVTAKANLCRREVPVTWRDSSGVMVEGVVDLAFQEQDRWVVVDFKTDEQIRSGQRKYEQQIRMYGTAVEQSTGRLNSIILMRL
jgi:ATP-dependent exoDNAse (exonuclease V) beta subunit